MCTRETWAYAIWFWLEVTRNIHSKCVSFSIFTRTAVVIKFYCVWNFRTTTLFCINNHHPYTHIYWECTRGNSLFLSFSGLHVNAHIFRKQTMAMTVRTWSQMFIISGTRGRRRRWSISDTNALYAFHIILGQNIVLQAQRAALANDPSVQRKWEKRTRRKKIKTTRFNKNGIFSNYIWCLVLQCAYRNSHCQPISFATPFHFPSTLSILVRIFFCLKFRVCDRVHIIQFPKMHNSGL